jgi:putative nucleotidyltransferase with HDIG domain
MNIKEQIVSKITSFPTLPVMANRLLHALNDPELASADIAKVIQYDPALTANVLKAANSAFLGFRNPVNSISEAAFRLGTKWIFQIAISSLIYSNLKKPIPGYDLDEEKLWKHSLAVALMSEALCALLRVRDSGSIYTGALLHDIGKAVIGEFVSAHFDEVQSLIDSRKITFEKAEEEVMGIDHAELGALIAENWRFPALIIDCIRWHHSPDSAPNITPAIDIVHIADSISLMEGFGYGRDELQYQFSDKSAARMNVNSNIIELAVSQTVMTLEDIENIFKDMPAARNGQEVRK